ncbi:hypothetical protein F8388_010011 [Cannabis sativa]|uniref:Uncharacterized protein n=1 Tax=Cannabis sativa TaxID=3483 RepID=A0A7J6E673_CANSA|nr:hypothetical protein G4B88_025289 [Cannabis sativa]KAF4353852.1 hypothetical protein F8388_010011 [Cannabis sativa]
MVMDSTFFAALSSALTCKIPFTSTSKLPWSRWNAREIKSAKLMTIFYQGSFTFKYSDGKTEFLGINFVITPPAVSIPKLSGFPKSLAVVTYVFVILFLDQFDEIVHDSVIKIFSTKMCISTCSQNFKDTIINGQDTDIKSTTTKIKHQNILFSSFLI